VLLQVCKIGTTRKFYSSFGILYHAWGGETHVTDLGRARLSSSVELIKLRVRKLKLMKL
jgi:hypothetical protein